MNQGIAHASGDLLWCPCTPPIAFSGPDVAAQAVGGAIRQSGDRCPNRGARGWIVSLGSIVVASLPLAGKQVVPHQASFFGSSVAKIGGYDL